MNNDDDEVSGNCFNAAVIMARATDFLQREIVGTVQN